MNNVLHRTRNLPLVLIIRRILRILPTTDKIKLVVLGFSQVLLSLLDLIGVACVGIIGSLVVNKNNLNTRGSRINSFFEFINISELSMQKQATILGIIAASAFILKTLFSIYFSRKTLYFLAVRSANITKNLIGKILNQSLLEIQKKSIQENVYMLTGGVGNVISGIMGTVATLIADISLLIVMLVALFYVDTVVSILTITIFGGVLIVLYFILHNKASYLGRNQANLSIKSVELIQEVLNSYRESFVGGKRSYYVNRIGVSQLELAKNSVKLTFLPSISKYILEISIVAGTLLIAGIQFIMSDTIHAVTVLTIFLASSSRIIPALLRIQQGLIFIKAMSSASIETLNTIETLLESEDIYGQSNIFKTSHAGFDCNIKLQNISFSYPDNPNLILDNISIQITSGESVAIVGKSGAGKTSLVDVLLGVIVPQEGTVKISGLKPKDAISKWPGAISYVPQDIQIINGTVRQNICLGYELDQIPEDAIWDALRVTQLEKLVKTLENGLDTYIGDRGSKWSGGERQRLGIARAIITQPKLLVMDESTSSLDGQTEHELASAILELKKNTTILLIAHRLSSIRSMEKIIYLDFGKIVSVGTFKKVREEVPDFEKQSQLMGL